MSAFRVKYKLSPQKKKLLRAEQELKVLAATIPDQQNLEKILKQVRVVFRAAVFEKLKPLLKFEAAADTLARVEERVCA